MATSKHWCIIHVVWDFSREEEEEEEEKGGKRRHVDDKLVVHTKDTNNIYSEIGK